MLDRLIPDFAAEITRLHEIAPAGFFLGFGVTFQGPEHLYNAFPPGWPQVYQKRQYYIADPALIWTFTNEGRTRWSDLRMPDVRGVLRRAAAHGLVYGATFSRLAHGRRSFLSMGRSDRELSDAELAEIDDKFPRWVAAVTGRADLSDGELDVLRCLRDGLGQRETAQALGIAESTVKQRAQKACRKLGATTRTQAVAIAMQRQYFDPLL